MTTLTLKKQIFDRIQNLNDKEFLREIYNLLNLQDEQEEVFKLSKEQRAGIRKAQKEIKAGNYLTNSAANKQTEKWLSQRK